MRYRRMSAPQLVAVAKLLASEIVVVNVIGRSAPARSMTWALSKEVSAVIAGGSQVVPYGLANRKN